MHPLAEQVRSDGEMKENIALYCYYYDYKLAKSGDPSSLPFKAFA